LMHRFKKELLRQEGKVIGTLDGRFLAKETDQVSEGPVLGDASSLSEVMHRNTALKVMVANGYYDLITPFFDAEYTFARHDFPQDRIIMKYYEAGHMMYNRQADFDALAKDVRAFLANVLNK
jgi:carboxypeptidase C (cathepsin A)